uniref:Ataxin 7 like 3 n=1 Tax=Ovis aries TaxID=9940 RepID=A0AC11EK50_SHEEP
YHPHFLSGYFQGSLSVPLHQTPFPFFFLLQGNLAIRILLSITTQLGSATRPWGQRSCAACSPRSLRCPQHTDEQRRAVRIYFLGPSAVLPEVESSLDNDSFDMTDSQALISRLQWDGSSDLSPSDSGSSKTSENQGWGLGTNSSESRKTKKKKSHLSLVGTASGLGSNKKKKPKPPAPPTPSIYDDIN